MTEIKQYKILHIVSGNYCLLAPIGDNKWVMDFCPGRDWYNPIIVISKDMWEVFWDNIDNQRLHWQIKNKYFNNLNEDDYSFTNVSRLEFELV